MVGAWARKGEVVAVMAPNCPEYGVIFHAVALAGGVLTTVNPTYTSGEVHHQLADSGATFPRDDPDVPRDGHCRDRGSAVSEVRHRRGRWVHVDRCGSQRTACAEQVPVGLDDVVVLPYLRGRPAWRRASCSRTATSSRTSARHSARSRWGGRRLRGGAAVLPHLRHAGAHEHGARAGATIVTMPRSISSSSCRCMASIASRACSSRLPWSSRWRSIRSSTSTTSSLRWILSGAAPLSADLDRVRPAAWLRRGTGLRHDRAVPGEPRHAAGHVQARVGRRDGAEHRDQHRRSGHTVAARSR